MRFKAMCAPLQGAEREVLLSWDSCVAIGYAGRNQDAVRAHMEELVKLGVPAPAMVPSMYWSDPERIAAAGPSEEIITGDLDFSVIEGIRSSINVYRDRRPELYRVN